MLDFCDIFDNYDICSISVICLFSVICSITYYFLRKCREFSFNLEWYMYAYVYSLYTQVGTPAQYTCTCTVHTVHPLSLTYFLKQKSVSTQKAVLKKSVQH